MKLIVATKNEDKLLEFNRILSPLGFEVKSQKSVGFEESVEETGTSFAENARLKAKAVYDKLHIPVIADDSGLMVDALGGKPGIYSARYSAIDGKNASAQSNNEKLLRELEGIKCKTARYVCAICLIDSNGFAHIIEETCEGEIGVLPRGKKGFGYDPLFLYQGVSFGEIDPEQKDKVSHRGKALRKLADKIRSWI